jgi:2-isopropylmalate synthase
LRSSDGQVHVQASVGTGPVDACFKAVDEIVKTSATLVEYRVHAVTEGIDALGEVSVKLRAQNGATAHPQRESQSPLFHGHGADTDIIVASVKAYLAALNRFLSSESNAHAV